MCCTMNGLLFFFFFFSWDCLVLWQFTVGGEVEEGGDVLVVVVEVGWGAGH